MYVCVCGCLATYVMRAVAKEELYGMSLMLKNVHTCTYSTGQKKLLQ